MPALRAIGERGYVISADLVPAPGGVLELFGVLHQPGLASTLLSAIAHGVSLEGAELLFRCDLVTTVDGRVVDRLEGKVADQEGRLLIAALDERFGNDVVRFHPGSQHHHYLVMKDSRSIGATADDLSSMPLSVIGRAVPRGHRKQAQHPLARYLAELAAQASEVLVAHEANQVRLDLRENPANDLSIWGGMQPSAVKLSAPVSFDAMVTTADYLVGLARMLDIRVVVGHRHAEMTEALSADILTLQRLLHSSDCVLLHVDISGWSSSPSSRRPRCLEQVDRLLVGPLQERVQRGDIRLAVVLLGDAVKRGAGRGQERSRCQAVLFDGDVATNRPKNGRLTEVLPWLCR